MNYIYFVTGHTTNIKKYSKKYMPLDMTDCYTWSFPEFLPFCLQLYYFSNFKDFNMPAQA